MPEVKRTDPKRRPDLFYLPDGQGEYTLASEEVDPILFTHSVGSIKVVAKKVFDGIAYFVFKSDISQIWWKRDALANPILVAECQLVGQVYLNDSWNNYPFEFSEANVSSQGDGRYRAIQTQGNNLFAMEWDWSQGSGKQSFFIDVPGQLVRLRWQCRVLESAIANPEQGKQGLSYSTHDYPGNVNHGSQADPEEGWVQHWWTFEPDGFTCDVEDERTPLQRYNEGAGLVVDPYLVIDEQATYVDVTCDGYVARVHYGGGQYHAISIRDPNNVSTEWIRMGSLVRQSTTSYALAQDAGVAVTIKEMNSVRVVIKLTGDFETGAYASLTNESGSEMWYYLYTDRILQRIKFNATGSITFDTSIYHGQCYADIQTANVANEVSKYESSGSEATQSVTAERNDADYLAVLSDEIDIMGINLLHDLGGGTAPYTQVLVTGGDRIGFRWSNGTVTALSEMAVLWVLDSADRSGSAKKYDSTKRLAIGDQWKDLNIENWDDATYHTDLVGYWTCDDDAASTTILAEVGSNGALAGGSNTEDVSSVTARQGTSFLLDGSADIINLSTCFNTDLTNKNLFTVVINARPTFAYNVAVDQLLLTIGSSSTNRLMIGYRASTDQWTIYNDIANAGVTTSYGRVYTSSVQMQKWVTVVVAVDLTNDVVALAVDGRILATESVTQSWSATPTYLYVGSNISENTFWTGYIDEITLLDGYLPYQLSPYVEVFTPVRDCYIPKNLTIDGFASDGGLHVIPNSNHKVKVVWDRLRYSNILVLDSTSFLDTLNVERLSSWWRFDDDAASTTILAENYGSGKTNGTLGGGDNTEDKQQVGALGGSFLFNGTDDYADLSSALSDISSTNKFTVSLRVKPNFTYSNSTSRMILEIGSSSSDRVLLYWSTGNAIVFQNDISDASTAYDLVTVSSTYETQQWWDIHLMVNLDADCIIVAVNGVVKLRLVATESWNATPTYFYVGRNISGSSNYWPGYVCDVKLYNGPICLGGGGPLPLSNDDSDFSIANSDVIFHTLLRDITSPTAEVAGGSSTITVGGSPSLESDMNGVSNASILFDASGDILTFPTSGNLDISQGSIMFWWKSVSAFDDSNDRVLFGGRGASNDAGDFVIIKTSTPQLYLLTVDSSSNIIYIYFNAAQITAWTTWTSLRFVWSSSVPVYSTHHMAMFIDGQYRTPAGGSNHTSPWTAGTPQTTQGIGNDQQDTADFANGYMSRLSITDNPFTPENWSSYGIPLRTLLLDVRE